MRNSSRQTKTSMRVGFMTANRCEDPGRVHFAVGFTMGSLLEGRSGDGRWQRNGRLYRESLG